MTGMRGTAAALALLLCPAGAGRAEDTAATIFQRGAWDVQVVDFGNGARSCVANVYLGDDSFSVWADQAQAIKLQFYSKIWDFGEGTTANLEVEIDQRGPWTMSNAELYLQSVLFDIPGSDDGVRFLREVMRGRTLYLRNESGQHVQAYTLSGSSASIQTLIDCMGQIGRSANPFN